MILNIYIKSRMVQQVLQLQLLMEYADVFNRFKVGDQTEQDIELLETRIRQPSDTNVNNGNYALFIAARNIDIKKFN